MNNKNLTIGDRVSDYMDNLLDIVIMHRGYSAAMLKVENFGNDAVKFSNYKNICRNVLSIASDLSTCYRDRKSEEVTKTTTDLLFAEWKKLLKVFETEETGRIKPMESDAITLMTLSNRTTIKKSDDCKDAIKARTEARKNYEEDPSAENEAELQKCEDLVAEIKSRSWTYYKDYTDVNANVFRKAVEDLMADIAEKRVRKTFAQKEEERKAENKKKRKSGKK